MASIFINILATKETSDSIFCFQEQKLASDSILWFTVVESSVTTLLISWLLRSAQKDVTVGQEMERMHFLEVQNLTMSLITSLSSEKLLNLPETVSYL